MMFSRPYISIPYLSPLLAILPFVCSPTYLCFNIGDHQTCGPLEGHWLIFLHDIHVLALHGPNGCKIIIDQIKAKNWNGFCHGIVLIIQITLGHFFLFMWNVVAHDVVASLIYFYFIYTFFFINLKDVCINVM